MNEEFQTRLLRCQSDLSTRLRSVRDARKALVYALRTTKELFGAQEAAVATLSPGRRKAERIFTIPQDSRWDNDLFTNYILGARPQIPQGLLLAPVERRDRNWAVLALKDENRVFSAADRQAFFAILQTLAETIRLVDDGRMREVRRKIERKLANRKDAKDLMYDILHGLRSLTHYDHSAALLISRDGKEPLEVVAEQIAWAKAKSRRIGQRMDCDEDVGREIRIGGVRVFERDGEAWRDVEGDRVSCLPEFLGREASSELDGPLETTMLCAPIATPDGSLGILKVSARRRGVLGTYEARLLEEFMSLASLAIQFSVRTESLHERMLQSERKHALADLTRGIAHDVNNAMGAVLPLVQQLAEDARNGRLRPTEVLEDLHHIEESIQTCRRIFGGMLAIAKGSTRAVGHGNLRRAVEAALSVLEDSLKRRAIRVVPDLPDELPTIRAGQGDLTQLVLNLCTNARDAMPRGGELTVAARHAGSAVEVGVHDTGCGIPADMVSRVAEPFFTTKPDGNGLGLSICRSVLRDIGGEMRIESEDGKGTSFYLSLPVLEQDGGKGSA